MSSLFDQIDLAAWQHELRDAHGRWARTGDMPAALQAKIKNRLAQQFGGTLAATGNWHWAGGKPQLGARVHDYHGNGGWVRGVTPGGWAAIEFDDDRRQVVKPDGAVLHDFYWNDMITLEEAGASDQQANDYTHVVQGIAPNPGPKPEAPAPDTVPPAEYGQNSQPVRELRKLLPEVMNAPALPGDQPTESHKEGDVEIVTLGDGSKVLFKEQVPERNDKEELSYYIAQAMGKSIGKPPQLPAIARDPDNPWNFIERVVPGTVGSRWLAEHLPPGVENREDAFTQMDEIEQRLLAGTDEGREIGLLDYLVSNHDRHSGNFIVDDQGKPHPIDMGEAEFDAVNYYNPFWDGSELGKPEADALEAELRKLQPEFDRLGHHDWYVIMMGRLHALTELSGQPGDVIELTGSPAYLHELRDAHGEWVHSPTDVPGKPGTPDRYKVPPHSRLLNPKAKYEDPADHPFFIKHPVSADNIIAAYDATPPEIRAEGMKWYHSAHLLAKAMGSLHGGNAEESAILLGNYSSSANWPINMFRAARVADERKPIPVGEGYVSTDQFKKAAKALAGGHIDEVLTSPKTRSFAHLLAHGDDSPDDPYGHVVIDAHALNVAAGGSMRGATYARGKKQQELPDEENPGKALQDARMHEYVGDMYRQAAAYIAHRDGIAISPHQMQAVTWVAQVLKNMAEDKAEMESTAGAKGRLSAKAKDWQRWFAWAKAHNFQLEPGVSALAGQALLAQVIELVGEDSVTVQLELASDAWRHELRGPDGRWIKSPASALDHMHGRVEQQRAQPANQGDLRLALIKSQVYTTQQIDHMQAEINRLQTELDQESKDEAKAVLVTHLAWIGAGIALALVISGVGLPPAVALLAAALPSLGSEASELAVVLGKGKHALAHPIAQVKAALHHHKPAMAVAHMASTPLHDRAARVLAAVLDQTGYTGSDSLALAHAFIDSRPPGSSTHAADSLAGQLVELVAADTVSDSIAAQALDLAFNVAEPRNRRGEWTTGLKPLDPFYNELPESGHRGTVRSKGTFGQAGSGRDREDAERIRAYRRQHPVASPITASEARGNSRPVSYDEFQEIAARGLNKLAALSRPTGTSGLDSRWGQIKRDAYAEVRKPWGGATIDTVTGQPLPQGADRFALSVKPAGMSTVSVPENASEAEFGAAMDRALAEFRDELAKGQRHLGVFHDDDNHRIDIDPVLVVDSIQDVEDIGSYSHAVGGAYRFSDGNGYFPPHVAEGAQMANDDGTVHWAGLGQWRSQADDVQPGLSIVQQAQISDTADDQDQ